MRTCPSCGSESPTIRGMVMSEFCTDPFHRNTITLSRLADPAYVENLRAQGYEIAWLEASSSSALPVIPEVINGCTPLNALELRDQLNARFKESGDARSVIKAITLDGRIYDILYVQREVHTDGDGSTTYWVKIEEF